MLCLDTCPTSYANEALPTTAFGGPVAFGYWDDLMINYASRQSIFYTVSGFSPNRTTVFEFNTGNTIQSTDQCHFQIIFNENRPGIVKYHYFFISDTGAAGTIGVQGMSISFWLSVAPIHIRLFNGHSSFITWTSHELLGRSSELCLKQFDIDVRHQYWYIYWLATTIETLTCVFKWLFLVPGIFCDACFYPLLINALGSAYRRRCWLHHHSKLIFLLMRISAERKDSLSRDFLFLSWYIRRWSNREERNVHCDTLEINMRDNESIIEEYCLKEAKNRAKRSTKTTKFTRN